MAGPGAFPKTPPKNFFQTRKIPFPKEREEGCLQEKKSFLKVFFMDLKRFLWVCLGRNPGRPCLPWAWHHIMPVEARAMKMKQVMKGTAIWVMAMSK